MQKHVNLVDLVKSFPTNIYLQNLASIQKRTSPIKFAHLAEKSENGSISNLSTKLRTPGVEEGVAALERLRLVLGEGRLEGDRLDGLSPTVLPSLQYVRMSNSAYFLHFTILF